MNESLSDYAREELVSFYLFGFFVVLGASLSSFVYVFSGFLTFVLLVGCAVGCMLLIKNTYLAGLNRGQQTKPTVNQKKERRNRPLEKIRPPNKNPPRLVVNNTRRVH
ncbi:MAG: hypothetical protein A3J55_00540 [Candidatus Ryanbacteria bacterium RIFCSPHIGHO2_02_FULL_45_17b]|uniref:Uncharacterized protein n=1 Tax=Candidatus Ryanbacteria bacterium RIFCSPHIGHO2_01_FULL_45_22 TaxID=1802114 RepID=A0A1G2G0S6_9BACT|nr:MAG: hypothetical protein A2719_03005 [Candidatus Ryanbacteria bacterium RIFCSPHIGHO2_01_FULL_45_22]OGZ47030.1 MAG: hypothetical protein A3J55_00540 [Candidatus Ryanbacteria bacterium RIFCSPHIGHO2_02_FULL_45_17b]